MWVSRMGPMTPYKLCALHAPKRSRNGFQLTAPVLKAAEEVSNLSSKRAAELHATQHEEEGQPQESRASEMDSTAKQDVRQTRIDAKRECLQLWGDCVQNLPELLCYLQLFHQINGPVLITQCEELLEKYVASHSPPGDLSWKKYGESMDVKRMFELKMFRLTASSNNVKVQPVDCILNAKLRLLHAGPTSDIFKVMTCLKEATTAVVLKRMEAGVMAGHAQLEEFGAAMRTLSELGVVAKVNDGLELTNSDEFFVLTDLEPF